MVQKYNSLAEKFRPKNWDSIIGNKNNKKFLKYTITNSDYNRAYLITGSQGTGKTTTAEIFWRSVLCQNREPQDPNPCGECEVCQELDETNITKYDVTDGAKAKEMFAALITKAEISPIPNPEARNNPRKRIILINEIQEASLTAQKNLLAPIENANPDVIWILVSMAEHKLHKALVERCSRIKMTTPSKKEMITHISNCLPNVTEDGAQAIVDLCGGDNIRQIWSYLDSIYPLYKDKEINSEIIYNNYGGGCTKDNRRKFWRSLVTNTQNSLSLLEQWLEENSEDIICDLLIRDLYNFSNITPLILELSRNLAVWKKAIARPPLKAEILFVVNSYNKVENTERKIEINSISDICI